MDSKSKINSTNSTELNPKDSSRETQESNELNRETIMNDQPNPPEKIEQPAQPGNGTSAPDFSRFRLSQNFGIAGKVTKRLVTVPVRKPGRTQFVRVHPMIKRDVMLLNPEEGRAELYLVEPDLEGEVAQLLKPHRLALAIDRQENVFFWPLAIPDEARPLNWHLSALEAAGVAESHWVRIQADMHLGAYQIFVAEGNLEEPTWPELSSDELLGLAFKNKIVDQADHPVLRKLKGLF